jgi:hypothetical protein
MGCCGDKRARPGTRSVRSTPGPRARQAASAPPAVVGGPPTFELVGTGSLTVDGPISGRRYRFTHAGAAVVVDARDASALGAVSALRRVGG